MNQENDPNGNRPSVSPVRESSGGARTLTTIGKVLLLVVFLMGASAFKYRT